MHSWLIRIIGVLGLMLSTPHTATAADDAQLTILVRDADGNALAGIWVALYLPQPPAPPRRAAEQQTKADGRLTVERLDPTATYILQFTSGIPIIIDGRQVGSIPSQYEGDQNALRQVQRTTDAPGWPVQAGRAQVYRFVIGGTFAEGKTAAAVPMLDLATRDDAPIRPVNPLTGEEMTAEAARTFHAVIGEPWGVARAAASTSPAPRPVDRTDAFPDASKERRLIGVMLIVALALAIQGVMLWHRRRRSI